MRRILKNYASFYSFSGVIKGKNMDIDYRHVDTTYGPKYVTTWCKFAKGTLKPKFSVKEVQWTRGGGWDTKWLILGIFTKSWKKYFYENWVIITESEPFSTDLLRKLGKW